MDLMKKLASGGDSAPEGGGSDRDAEAKALKAALDAGKGGRAYEIIKGWVHDCQMEEDSDDEEM